MSAVLLRSTIKIFIAICLLLAVTVPSKAHHSAARIDTTATIEVTGVVNEFAWRNPHAWIKLAVTDNKGNVVIWRFEGNGATYILRTGWRRTSIKVGDTVTIVANPLKTAKPGGRFFAVKFADGSTIGLKKDGTRAPQSSSNTKAEGQL